MKHQGRKLYHVIGGVSLLSLYYVLGRDRALLLYAVLFITVLAADFARLRIPAVNRFIFARFGGFIRKNEEHNLTGTPAYILGIGLSLFLFSPSIATAAVCFLAFGDVAATSVGEQYGKTKIRNKSLEGTAAFVIAGMLAGLFLFFIGISPSPVVMAIGIAAAAGVELLPLPINDNLVIPLVSGGIMQLFLKVFSIAMQ